MPIINWNAPVQVNAAGKIFAQTSAATATLYNGDYVVVWTHQDSINGYKVLAQRFTSAGTKIGGEITVSENSELYATAPDVTAVGGGFVVTWSKDQPASNLEDIKGRLFDLNGNAGSVFNVSNTIFNDDYSANCPNGTGFAVAHEFGANNDIVLRRFDLNGNQLGNTIVVNQTPAPHESYDNNSLEITELFNGNLVVAWNGDGNVKYRVFSSYGTAVSQEMSAGTGANGTFDDVTVISRGQNGFMLAWYDENPGAGQGNVRGMLYDSNGINVSVEFNVSLEQSNGGYMPKLVELKDGRVMASWITEDGRYIQVRVFNPATGVAEPQFFVDLGDHQVDPIGISTQKFDISLLADGRINLTWTSEDNSVWTKILDPRNGMVDGTAGSDTLYGNNALNDTMKGSFGQDWIYGLNGNDIIEGGLHSDHIYGGYGNDTIYAYTQANPGGSFDNEYLYGSFGDDTIYGSSGKDVIDGGGDRDTISGGAGMDTIKGGAGNDTISGGAGNDTIDGGDGADTVTFADATAGITIDLAKFTKQFIGIGQGDDTISNVENVIGSDFGDFITGSGEKNWLSGLDGDDSLIGGTGDDILNGGAGNDVLDGGTGADTADYSGFDAVTVNLGKTGPQNVGAGLGLDTLSGFEHLFGSFMNDTLIGDFNFNKLDGSDGNDKLIGGGGDDLLRGGDDNDLLAGGEGADQLIGGEGIDLADYGGAKGSVSAALDHSFAGTGEALGDVYSGMENLRGSNFGDTLYGNSGDNAILGLAGDDVIAGLAGQDQLTGGDGNDFFYFTAFSDSHRGLQNRDTIKDFTDGDIIALQVIDANEGLAGNQAFVFDTNGDFKAGEIRQTVLAGGHLLLAFNVDDDSETEMEIVVANHAAFLDAGDFIL
jgi:Ca2+-binding RTX toxin-like protein